MAGTYVFGTLLTANGSLKYLNLIAMSGVAASIALNLWLIPIWGPVGAAAACLATQLFTFLLQFGLAARMFRFGVVRRDVGFTALFIILLLTLPVLTAGLNWTWNAALLLTSGGLGTLVLTLPDLRLLRSSDR
jgi:O-antigen/teichoic acid export membrane protein